MAEKNAVTDLLRTPWNLGTKWLEGEIFGSQPANEVQVQAEKNDRNKVNGSGPTNNQAAAQAPKSWTEYIFGSAWLQTSAKTDAKDRAGGVPPLFIWLAIGALIYLVYRHWK